MDSLSSFLGKIVSLIIQPLIALLFALALFFFVYGVAAMILNAGDPKKLEQGKRMLLWSVVGFFVMVGAVSILGVVTITFCGSAFCK